MVCGGTDVRQRVAAHGAQGNEGIRRILTEGMTSTRTEGLGLSVVAFGNRMRQLPCATLVIKASDNLVDAVLLLLLLLLLRATERREGSSKKEKKRNNQRRHHLYALNGEPVVGIVVSQSGESYAGGEPPRV